MQFVPVGVVCVHFDEKRVVVSLSRYLVALPLSKHMASLNGLATFIFWHRALLSKVLICLTRGHIDWKGEGQGSEYYKCQYDYDGNNPARTNRHQHTKKLMPSRITVIQSSWEVSGGSLVISQRSRGEGEQIYWSRDNYRANGKTQHSIR